MVKANKRPSRKVRVIRAFSFYRVGQILEPPGVQRQFLLERKFVEPVEEEQQRTDEPETAAVAPPEKMVRKRGRPRKVRAKTG